MIIINPYVKRDADERDDSIFDTWMDGFDISSYNRCM